MNITAVPRTAIRYSVAVSRLPLTAAEAILGHHDEPTWGPTVTFDRVQAQVKQALGDALHDHILIEEGRMTIARIEKLEQATKLDDLASERRQTADDELAEARTRTAKQRKQATTAANRRKKEAARQAEQAEKAAADAARRKEDLVEQATAGATEAVERTARRERAAALAKEQVAIDKKKAATAKARKAVAADKRIAASKASAS
jgi:hypothetical protein